MKFYSILNLNRQQNGPSVVTEEGLKQMQKAKALEKTYKVIGECDAHGNLLSAIAEGNFMSAPVKRVAPVVKVPKVPDIDDDAPQFQVFSEEDKIKLKNLKDETRRQAESGLARERALAGQAEEETVGTSGKPGSKRRSASKK